MGHMSKECYFQNPLPGTKLKDFNSFTTSPLTTESKYFCVVTIKIDKIDWLYLKREGHRRAKIYLNNIAQSHCWPVNADGRTRTGTTLATPQDSVSTNSTTSAIAVYQNLVFFR